MHRQKKKKESRYYSKIFELFTKINSKHIIAWNVKCSTIKLQKKKGKNLSELEFGGEFFKLIYFNWMITILQYCDGFRGGEFLTTHTQDLQSIKEKSVWI